MLNKSKFLYVSVLVVALLMAITSSIDASNYYVSPQGSDSNIGSQSNPWKTIQKAVDTVPVGSTVMVSSGNYPQVTRLRRDDIRLECVVPRTCITHEFFVSGNRDAVVGFKTVGALQKGFETWGTNNLIENNEITDTLVGLNGDEDCMRVFGSGHTIRGNYCHDDEIAESAHADCFQTWDYPENGGAVNNSVFENNTCIQRNKGPENSAGFQLSGNAHHLIIRNNLIMVVAGIRGYTGEGGNPHDLLIEHNTFVGPGGLYSTGYGIGITIKPGDRITVKNNIFTEMRRGTAQVEPDYSLVDYNLSYNSSVALPSASDENEHPHDSWGVNPKFTSDYHLQTGSPACTAGEGGIYVGAFPCVVLGTPLPQIKVGDLNTDNIVDISDYIILVSDFGKIGSNGFIISDILKNGAVDIFDFNKLITNFGM